MQTFQLLIYSWTSSVVYLLHCIELF